MPVDPQTGLYSPNAGIYPGGGLSGVASALSNVDAAGIARQEAQRRQAALMLQQLQGQREDTQNQQLQRQLEGQRALQSYMAQNPDASTEDVMKQVLPYMPESALSTYAWHADRSEQAGRSMTAKALGNLVNKGVPLDKLQGLAQQANIPWEDVMASVPAGQAAPSVSADIAKTTAYTDEAKAKVKTLDAIRQPEVQKLLAEAGHQRTLSKLNELNARITESGGMTPAEKNRWLSTLSTLLGQEGRAAPLFDTPEAKSKRDQAEAVRQELIKKAVDTVNAVPTQNTLATAGTTAKKPTVINYDENGNRASTP